MQFRFLIFIILSFSNYRLAVGIVYYPAISPDHLSLVDSKTAILSQTIETHIPVDSQDQFGHSFEKS